MPKGGKKKKQDDNWEDEADAIYELEKSKDAAAAKESKIDALFAEAIAKGKLTEAEQDRATDDLASGAKTEDEIIAFYFPNAAAVDITDEADGDSSKADKKKGRGWRAERDGRFTKLTDAPAEEGVDDAAAAAAEAAAISQLHAELFGVAGAANALDVSADGFGDERERVICSEVTIDEWRRAVADAPKELPLPNMTAACLFGRYGASTHAGGLLRLWDAGSGRRLTAHQQKQDFTALAACGSLVVVGDAVGALHLYNTEADSFTPTRLPPTKTAAGAVRSVALLPFAAGADSTTATNTPILIVASAQNGVITATIASPIRGPPRSRARRAASPTFRLPTRTTR